MAPSPFTKPPGPVALIVLDGVGIAPPAPDNAWSVASTPTLDALAAGDCPDGLPAGTAVLSTQLDASGGAVGLRDAADAGNSEVGHVALGAGRVFPQGAAAVDAGLSGGRLHKAETWRWLMEVVGGGGGGHDAKKKSRGADGKPAAAADGPDRGSGESGGNGGQTAASSQGTLHLLGLLSDGGVHAVMDHVWLLLDAAVADGVRRIRVHVLTDGRDTGERDGVGAIAQLEAKLAALRDEAGVDAAVASGGGRQDVTMDRYETDWGVVARGWRAHVLADTDAVATFPSATAAVQAAYDGGATDQHVPAFVVVDDAGAPVGRMADGDAVVLWNYRGDRAKEMAAALDTPPSGDWPHFDRGDVPALRFAGMLTYDEEQGVPRRSLVGSEPIDQPVGAVVAAAGLRRLCVAETKKYGHLTYFFNGHRATPFDDATETYVQVDSLPGREQDNPAMATAAVTDVIVAAIRGDADAVAPPPDLLCVNLANGDMCGHTGVMDAAVAGMEAVDAATRRLLAAVVAAGGVAVVTADHGNAEQMAAHGADGRPLAGDAPQGWTPLTAHTTARVPLWVVGAGVGGMAVDGRARWDAGAADRDAACTGAGIANISAAVLHLLGVDSPDAYLPSVLVAKGERGGD